MPLLFALAVFQGDGCDHRTTEDGDHEKFAHVVVPASAVTEAYVTGTPVTALCGKTCVPSRDPLGRPVCERCQEILKQYRATGSN